MGVERDWKGWCGVVWYGVVWHCVVWCGVVWYGMVWYGMVCQGVPSAKAFQGPRRVCQDRPQGGTCTATLDWKGWCGMVWYGVVWHGMVWCGVVWYGMVWCGMVCQGVPSAEAFQWSRRSNGQGECGNEGNREAHAQRRRSGHCGGKGEQAWWVVGERLGSGLECVCAKACQVQRRSNGQGVPMAKASVAIQATGRRMHSDVGADTAGERASKHGGWWERGLGQGLSAFMDKFVWTLGEH
jgi:hypothetical protein